MESERAPKPFVLDDDPTGTQSVHGVPVLTAWNTADLERELADPAPACFLLANSRALPETEACRIARETGAALRLASARTGIPATVVSRSDSTLRGHFPAEVDALAEGMGMAEAPILLCPFFAAGGRVTIEGTHYLLDNGRRIPVGETEFARDTTFGYRASFLPEWVAERSGGRITQGEVGLIDLTTVRGLPEGLDHALFTQLTRYRVVVPDAETSDDIARLASSAARLEASGLRFIARTAADYAAARAGISPQPPLDPATLALQNGPLLVAVGSYVDKTTRQLEALLRLPGLHGVELSVDAVLANEMAARSEIEQCATKVRDLIRNGQDTVVHTSRRRNGAGDLVAGSRVADALAEVLETISTRPRAVVSKGGITSSRTAVDVLGIRRGWVAGAALPGVPVWISGPESRFPGLPLVVFPGNVGDNHALVDIVMRWRDPDDCRVLAN